MENWTHFLHHWVYQDFWTPIWPNLAADFIVGTSLYLWGKRLVLKFHLRLDQDQNELKDLMSKTIKEELLHVRAKEPKQ